MQFIAGMLGSMGVQGAVQVMHTTIPMEWTPNMGEPRSQDLHNSLDSVLTGKGGTRDICIHCWTALQHNTQEALNRLERESPVRDVQAGTAEAGAVPMVRAAMGRRPLTWRSACPTRRAAPGSTSAPSSRAAPEHSRAQMPASTQGTSSPPSPPG